MRNVNYQLISKRGLIPIQYEAVGKEELETAGWKIGMELKNETIYAKSDDMYHHNFARVVGRMLDITVYLDTVINWDDAERIFGKDPENLVELSIPERYIVEYLSDRNRFFASNLPEFLNSYTAEDTEGLFGFLSKKKYPTIIIHGEEIVKEAIRENEKNREFLTADTSMLL